MKKKGATAWLALIAGFSLTPLIPATAHAASAAAPDELYWLPPALVEHLSGPTRARLVALAADIVAGRERGSAAIL